jgi:hypothetical protein
VVLTKHTHTGLSVDRVTSYGMDFQLFIGLYLTPGVVVLVDYVCLYVLHFFKLICWGPSLTPSLFIEVPVPSKEGEWSCICARVYKLWLFLRISYWILELFRQCCIVCFSLYMYTYDRILVKVATNYASKAKNRIIRQ